MLRSQRKNACALLLAQRYQCDPSRPVTANAGYGGEATDSGQGWRVHLFLREGKEASLFISLVSAEGCICYEHY